MKILVATAAVALTVSSSAAAGNLMRPESALVHKGKIYVSQQGVFEQNQPGAVMPGAATDGSIVIVNRKGKVLKMFAQGLVDPTGMTVIGNTLWVNDGAFIRSYNTKTGAPAKVIDLTAIVPNGTFINDLAAVGKTLWATNAPASVIYRVKMSGNVKTFPLPKGFVFPNGIALNPKTKQLWIVTTDPRLFPGVSGKPGAAILRMTKAGVMKPVKRSAALRALDGIVFQGNRAIVSDPFTGRIWKLLASGKLRRIATLKGSPADIGYDAANKRLLVPLIEAGKFTTLRP